MKKCALCDHEYDGAYDGCPKCARVRPQGERSLVVRLTNPRGRSSRRDFALVFLGAALIAALLGALSYSELQRNTVVGPLTVLSVFWALLQAPVVVIAGIRRLHDLGKSGWMILLAFVPVANIFMIFYLLAVPGTPEPLDNASDTPLGPKLRWVLRLVGVLLVASTVTATYYSYYSQAVKTGALIPVGAHMDDVDKIAGKPSRVSTVGNLKYLTYSFRDMSAINCTYVGEQQTRTRKVPRMVEVQKTRQVYREIGWDFYLNMPRYGFVTEPYTTTQLKSVDENYEVTVWRVRSLRSTFDLSVIKHRLGFDGRTTPVPTKTATPYYQPTPQAESTVEPLDSAEGEDEVEEGGGFSDLGTDAESDYAIFSITDWDASSITGWEWYGSGGEDGPQKRSFSISDRTEFFFTKDGDYDRLESVSRDEFFDLLAEHQQATPENQNGRAGNVFWENRSGMTALVVEANILGE